MISAAPSLETPLTRKMAAFSHKLLILILGLTVLVLAVGLARGERLEEIVLVGHRAGQWAPSRRITCCRHGHSPPSASPEWRSVRAIIRKLPAVETLGSNDGDLF